MQATLDDLRRLDAVDRVGGCCGSSTATSVRSDRGAIVTIPTGRAAGGGSSRSTATFLPLSADTPVVTLLEGGTPLVPAPRLSERVGATVWLKVEGANPTGSFKDRGMTMAISKAVEEGAKAVVCASTGNTSASAAAYAARAGLACAVLIPEGHIALGQAGPGARPRGRGCCRSAATSTRR